MGGCGRVGELVEAEEPLRWERCFLDRWSLHVVKQCLGCRCRRTLGIGMLAVREGRAAVVAALERRSMPVQADREDCLTELRVEYEPGRGIADTARSVSEP